MAPAPALAFKENATSTVQVGDGATAPIETALEHAVEEDSRFHD
jgi:hypothetical protein